MAKASKKKARGTPARGTARAAQPINRTSTDRISGFLDAKKLVPEHLRGTDEFLDVVSWNIAWFDHQDPDRIKAITDVLDTLNADVFVLLEIAADGALDEVAKLLAQRKAGFYSVAYGSTGSQQRVVLMWDRDWVRSKEDPKELFGDENLVMKAEFGDGKQKVFPRLPLWGYFEGLAENPNEEGFTFELVGVHLKAQGPAPQGYRGPAKRWGVPQRTQAAERVVTWLKDANAHFDTDVLIIGDWNAVPSEKEWAPIRKLEDEGEIAFEQVNDEDEISHMVRLNASGPAGSRIDLHLVTDEAVASAVPANLGAVIQWKPFEDLDALDSKQRKDLFARLKKRFSDHLPVVSRFYLKPPNA